MGTINSTHSALYSAIDNLAIRQSQDRNFAFCAHHETNVNSWVIYYLWLYKYDEEYGDIFIHNSLGQIVNSVNRGCILIE